MKCFMITLLKWFWNGLEIEMKFQGNDIVLEHGSILIYTYPNISDKIDVVAQWYVQFCYQYNEGYEELL